MSQKRAKNHESEAGMPKKSTSSAKPIETHYQGHRFRSRLEARWAVFFESLRIQYSYEPEGFDFGGLRYLPDFYLPKFDYWIEVKPREPEPDSLDWQKAAALASHVGKDVYIAVGLVWPPYDGDPGRNVFDRGVCNYHRPVHPGGNPASHSWWYECPTCKALSLTVFGRHNKLICSCPSLPYFQMSDSPRLLEAYRAARSARFEFGEKPRV